MTIAQIEDSEALRRRVVTLENQVKRLTDLLDEFTEFCGNSGWHNVAEELRRRTKDALEGKP